MKPLNKSIKADNKNLDEMNNKCPEVGVDMANSDVKVHVPTMKSESAIFKQHKRMDTVWNICVSWNIFIITLVVVLSVCLLLRVGIRSNTNNPFGDEINSTEESNKGGNVQVNVILISATNTHLDKADNYGSEEYEGKGFMDDGYGIDDDKEYKEDSLEFGAQNQPLQTDSPKPTVNVEDKKVSMNNNDDNNDDNDEYVENDAHDKDSDEPKYPADSLEAQNKPLQTNSPKPTVNVEDKKVPMNNTSNDDNYDDNDEYVENQPKYPEDSPEAGTKPLQPDGPKPTVNVEDKNVSMNNNDDSVENNYDANHEYEGKGDAYEDYDYDDSDEPKYPADSLEAGTKPLQTNSPKPTGNVEDNKDTQNSNDDNWWRSDDFSMTLF